MASVFTNPESWTGGSIEALMFFGDDGKSDIVEITRAIWSHHELDGPYLNPSVEPAAQRRYEFANVGEDHIASLFGTMKTYDGHRVPFRQFALVDEHGLWVYAGPTVGGLPTTWDVGGYPLDDGKPATWLPPLVEQLRGLAAYVHARCPMRAATFGWLTLLDIAIVLEALSGTIPNQRWAGISVWQGDEDTYYPLNCTSNPLKL